ncbi:hypothetical protein KUTeg_023814 [Tegillarca granosa]|uniref:Uncharacterized protein n=1 Tax=Tegillarca granosa TaxID=220873 RepID=A0ABQ9E353_TEGGR|nr:hypothetical protein KUTeg_023814 [Tegillarca granosa]
MTTALLREIHKMTDNTDTSNLPPPPSYEEVQRYAPPPADNKDQSSYSYPPAPVTGASAPYQAGPTPAPYPTGPTPYPTGPIAPGYQGTTYPPAQGQTPGYPYPTQPHVQPGTTYPTAYVGGPQSTYPYQGGMAPPPGGTVVQGQTYPVTYANTVQGSPFASQAQRRRRAII